MSQWQVLLRQTFSKEEFTSRRTRAFLLSFLSCQLSAFLFFFKFRIKNFFSWELEGWLSQLNACCISTGTWVWIPGIHINKWVQWYTSLVFLQTRQTHRSLHLIDLPIYPKRWALTSATHRYCIKWWTAQWFRNT